MAKKLETIMEVIKPHCDDKKAVQCREEDFQKLRASFQRLSSLLNSNEQKANFFANESYLPMVVYALQSIPDRQIRVQAIRSLFRLVCRSSNKKYAPYLVQGGVTRAACQAMYLESVESSPSEEFLIRIHQLLCRIGPLDKRLGVRARINQCLPITLGLLRSQVALIGNYASVPSNCHSGSSGVSSSTGSTSTSATAGGLHVPLITLSQSGGSSSSSLNSTSTVPLSTHISQSGCMVTIPAGLNRNLSTVLRTLRLYVIKGLGRTNASILGRAGIIPLLIRLLAVVSGLPTPKVYPATISSTVPLQKSSSSSNGQIASSQTVGLNPPATQRNGSPAPKPADRPSVISRSSSENGLVMGSPVIGAVTATASAAAALQRHRLQQLTKRSSKSSSATAASNGTHYLATSVNSLLSTMPGLIAVGVKYHAKLLRLILNTLHCLIKWKQNVTRTIDAGGISILLDLFLDIHRCDLQARRLALQRSLLACLKSLTSSRAGRKLFISCGGLHAMFAICAGYVGPDPLYRSSSMFSGASVPSHQSSQSSTSERSVSKDHRKNRPFSVSSGSLSSRHKSSDSSSASTVSEFVSSSSHVSAQNALSSMDSKTSSVQTVVPVNKTAATKRESVTDKTEELLIILTEACMLLRRCCPRSRLPVNNPEGVLRCPLLQEPPSRGTGDSVEKRDSATVLRSEYPAATEIASNLSGSVSSTPGGLSQDNRRFSPTKQQSDKSTRPRAVSTEDFISIRFPRFADMERVFPVNLDDAPSRNPDSKRRRHTRKRSTRSDTLKRANNNKSCRRNKLATVNSDCSAKNGTNRGALLTGSKKTFQRQGIYKSNGSMKSIACLPIGETEPNGKHSPVLPRISSCFVLPNPRSTSSGAIDASDRASQRLSIQSPNVLGDLDDDDEGEEEDDDEADEPAELDENNVDDEEEELGFDDQGLAENPSQPVIDPQKMLLELIGSHGRFFPEWSEFPKLLPNGVAREMLLDAGSAQWPFHASPAPETLPGVPPTFASLYLSQVHRTQSLMPFHTIAYPDLIGAGGSPQIEPFYDYHSVLRPSEAPPCWQSSKSDESEKSSKLCSGKDCNGSSSLLQVPSSRKSSSASSTGSTSSTTARSSDRSRRVTQSLDNNSRRNQSPRIPYQLTGLRHTEILDDVRRLVDPEDLLNRTVYDLDELILDAVRDAQQRDQPSRSASPADPTKGSPLLSSSMVDGVAHVGHEGSTLKPSASAASLSALPVTSADPAGSALGDCRLVNDDECRVNCFDAEKGHLEFESRFESGNLRKAIQVRLHEYDLVLNPDVNTVANVQWFYFRVSNMEANVNYRFNVINCEKPGSQFTSGMQPVLFSVREALEGRAYWVRSGKYINYYRNHFTRVSKGKRSSDENTHFTATFTLRFPHTGDVCYVAYHYPHTYTRLLTDLLRWHHCAQPRPNLYFHVQTLTHSILGNPVPLITITGRGSGLGYEDADRPYIFLTARVHSGESNSSWVMQGLIDRLLAEDSVTVRLREMFVFKIVPMLNPDGVICGNHRCSMSGRDLNRRWLSPSPELHPTIYHSKALLSLLHACGRQPYIFIDFHGHSRMKNVFLYGCSPLESWKSPDLRNPTYRVGPTGHSEDKAYRYLAEVLDGLAPAFSKSSCHYTVIKSKESAARVAVWREFRVMRSYTLEASYCGITSSGHQLNPDHLREFGSQLILAFYQLPDYDGLHPYVTVTRSSSDDVLQALMGTVNKPSEDEDLPRMSAASKSSGSTSTSSTPSESSSSSLSSSSNSNGQLSDA